VAFSEPVELPSATHIANYDISNGINISNASLASDLTTVTLTSSPHTEGLTYTLTVNNIKDRASTPNVIASDTQKAYTFIAQLIISNLTVASGQPYEVVDSGLQPGALVYLDRSYTFTNVPTALEGTTYIKTANGDKGSSGSSFLSFDVNQDVTVYVGHDNRNTTKPSWMASFADTGDDIVTSDSSFSLFAKNFPAGTITLGGNEARSMYIPIIVKAILNTGLPAAPTNLTAN